MIGTVRCLNCATQLPYGEDCSCQENTRTKIIVEFTYLSVATTKKIKKVKSTVTETKLLSEIT